MRTDTTEVADGVVRIAGSRTNAYVIADGDDVCLVDTGYPGDLDRVSAALGTIGRAAADVTAVLLTHAHVDHIGSAERFRREHGAAVHAHADEAAHARGEREERISNLDMLLRLWWPKMWSFLGNVLSAGGTTVEHVTEVTTFVEDGALDLPGAPVPLFTPGHTSGHCSYHLPDRGVVITGDALVTHDSLTGARGPRLLNHLFNHDHAAATASLQRLAGVDADVLLPGHGDPWRGDPADAVQQAATREGPR